MEFNVWWVSQNQSYKYESRDGYIWSPKVNRNDSRNHFYDNMRLVKPGDLIFSYASSRLVSLGVIKSCARTAAIPEDHITSNSWSNEGWKVDVEYNELTNKISPTEHFNSIKPLLPEKYGPLNSSGQGNQAYLFAIPHALCELLVSLIGAEARAIIDGFSSIDRGQLEQLIADEQAYGHETTVVAIVEARKGQGKYKTNVLDVENCCRLTGVTNQRHLIASHIKPWRHSDNRERLDGNNGLLLSPHVDHLFDRGHITFSDSGDLIIGKSISKEVLRGWHISSGNYGSFNEAQKQYLSYHREKIYQTTQNQFLGK